MMKSLTACPVCHCSNLRHHLYCKDHTVSHETFELQKCTACGFVLTNPRPDDADLPRYYQSKNYISHSEKTAGLINQVYRIARRFTLTWKYRIVLRHSLIKPKKLLDYGCGTGAFISECRNKNIDASGIEPSEAARAVAIRNTQAHVYRDVDTVKDVYDVITLWHVLEHVPDLHQVIDKLKALLEQNGTIFIAVPNLESKDAHLYGKNWAGYDVPRHLWHFSKDTMKRILNTHHLKIIAILPMRLDAYYVSLLSEKYHGQQNSPLTIMKAIIAGWNSNRNARTTENYSSLIYIVRK